MTPGTTMTRPARAGCSCVLLVLLLAALGRSSALRVPSLLDRGAYVEGRGQLLKPGRGEQQSSSIKSSSEGVHSQQNEEHVPSIELAARQFLFNYGAQRGLDILRDRVQDLQVPDVSKAFNLPLVGEFKLQLSNIRVTQFNASSQEAKLSILDGNFDLWVTQVEVQILFQWHWEKLGMQGTGSGELDLHGGSIDYKFRVSTTDEGKPRLLVDDVSSRFSSVDLTIRSFSADWLYQAVMSLFNDQIQKAIQNGIASALQKDVPEGINKVLNSLPTRVNVQGLPFTLDFQYSIFDLSFVMVQGYGLVDSGGSSSSSSSSSSSAAVATTGTGTTSDASSGANTAVTAAAATGAALATNDVDSARRRRRLQGLSPCPFPSSPLPLSHEQIAADGRMVTIYLHQSMVNCLAWGLYSGNMMQFDLVDGTIPKLHLTTDLLVMLIPGLPRAYPHQSIRITGQALAQPTVAFDAQGVTITVSYRTSIYVANETAGNPKIVTMAANLTIQGQINYDTTIITSAVAKHTVEDSSMPVSAPQWDNTVAWFVQNYAGLYPLQFLIEHFVQTPVTSLVGLVNAEAVTYDGGWYALSGDVVVHPA